MPVATDKPVNAHVRFLPTDLVVPKGGKLRLTISGSVAYSKGESQPSGSASNISILHDCKRPGALRFVMPQPRVKLLNVREKDEAGTQKLRSRPAFVGRRDAAGLAVQSVCGERPNRVPFLK